MRLQWKVTYLHSLATLAGVILLTAGGTAHGVDFPAKPARIVVPIGPGSSMDIIARVLAQKLNESWEQPVIVDNRAGAGGNIGADLVAKSPASREQGSRLRDANVREQGESAVG